MKTNADGSLTIYIQNRWPGADKEANWLPAPNGPIYLVMRLYWPKTTVCPTSPTRERARRLGAPRPEEGRGRALPRGLKRPRARAPPGGSPVAQLRQGGRVSAHSGDMG